MVEECLNERFLSHQVHYRPKSHIIKVNLSKIGC